MNKPKKTETKNLGGRPPKYNEPSRPVTVTLPESALQRLQRIDPDRGQAIVKLTESLFRTDKMSDERISVTQMADGVGLIIVGPSNTLRSIPFVRLVEVAPLRYLIALDRTKSFGDLEIALQDVLEDFPKKEIEEKEMIAELHQRIRQLRKGEHISMAEIVLVSMNGATGR